MTLEQLQVFAVEEALERSLGHHLCVAVVDQLHVLIREEFPLPDAFRACPQRDHLVGALRNQNEGCQHCHL